MGKPYLSELNLLGDIYQWSLSAPVTALTNFVARSSLLPLTAVGSGGSLTAAHAAAIFHQSLGQVARATTPLELIRQPQHTRSSSVLFLTAGGGNPDVLAAFQCAARSEPRELAAICMAENSPLAALAQDFRFSDVLEYPLPSGRDGFLATNTLLSAITLLGRAYAELSDVPCCLPTEIAEAAGSLERLALQFGPLLERDTWVVLHGLWSAPAAHDLESKFTEAALAHALPADYRNFAHGRHHWLAKRADESAVLALVTPEDADLAERTLALLPASVPTATIRTESDGPAALIDLLVQVLYLVALVGRDRGIDPGRPSVPPFGRRIYHLRIPANPTQSRSRLTSVLDSNATVQRKLRTCGVAAASAGQVTSWTDHCHRFVEALTSTRFGAVVLDYDGTLCDARERFQGMRQEVGRELERLSRAGITVGIATGRGRSVRDQLRDVLPAELWERMVIGYYNGSDIGSLSDPSHPDREAPHASVLIAAKDALQQSHRLEADATLECRPQQLTLVPKGYHRWHAVRGIALDCLSKLGSDVKVVESSHSLDIVPTYVSKTEVVSRCAEVAARAGKPMNVLCIGDRGEWPGNDHALLATPYSLSVDSVSPSSETCWNIAPQGFRGPQAALWYLQHVQVDDGVATFTISRRR